MTEVVRYARRSAGLVRARTSASMSDAVSGLMGFVTDSRRMPNGSSRHGPTTTALADISAVAMVNTMSTRRASVQWFTWV